ncbi:MAG: HlyD family efflux transporter periplasmic adaptor subunit [Motiliproteus sp.]
MLVASFFIQPFALITPLFFQVIIDKVLVHQHLPVHTVVGVVTPAQILMLVVPKQSQLEVEAMILNIDIGFVEEGMAAAVKIDTFNFTKYGLIEGEIAKISEDTFQDENLGLVYSARVTLKQDKLQVENKWVRLSPGMSVTREIKTGQRRLIEYFLSPLLGYRQERERQRMEATYSAMNVFRVRSKSCSNAGSDQGNPADRQGEDKRGLPSIFVSGLNTRFLQDPNV